MYFFRGVGAFGWNSNLMAVPDLRPVWGHLGSNLCCICGVQMGTGKLLGSTFKGRWQYFAMD